MSSEKSIIFFYLIIDELYPNGKDPFMALSQNGLSNPFIIPITRHYNQIVLM